jgi:hypothetical protein
VAGCYGWEILSQSRGKCRCVSEWLDLSSTRRPRHVSEFQGDGATAEVEHIGPCRFGARLDTLENLSGNFDLALIGYFPSAVSAGSSDRPCL